MSHIDEMESLKKSGGPAFPMGHFRGMTLRDYFAAKFMATFLQGSKLPPGFDASEQIAFAAVRAFECADAMLAERAK